MLYAEDTIHGRATQEHEAAEEPDQLQQSIDQPREADHKSHERSMHQIAQWESDAFEENDWIGPLGFSIGSDVRCGPYSQEREELLKIRPVRDRSSLTLESSVDQIRSHGEPTPLCHIDLPGGSDSGHFAFRVGVPGSVREAERAGSIKNE